MTVAGASGIWDTVRWVLGVSSTHFFLALFLTWSLRVTLDSCVIKEQPYAMQLCQVQRKHQADRSLGAGLQRCWFVSACPVMLLDADGCGCAFTRRTTTKTAFQFAASRPTGVVGIRRESSYASDGGGRAQRMHDMPPELGRRAQERAS